MEIVSTVWPNFGSATRCRSPCQHEDENSGNSGESTIPTDAFHGLVAECCNTAKKRVMGNLRRRIHRVIKG
jgi:hypothetical protein